MPCGVLPAWMPGEQSGDGVSCTYTVDMICSQSRAAAGACCGDKKKTWIHGCATLRCIG